MKAVTVKSAEVMDETLQLEVHYAFGMEHYTDYVFRPRDGMKYSVTVVMDDSTEIMKNVVTRCASFPDREFVMEVLEIGENALSHYVIKNGSIVE